MDPTSQIFNGTPSAVSEDDLLQMEMDDKRRLQEIQATGAEEEEQEQTGAATATPTQQTAKPKEAEQPKSEFKNADGSINQEAIGRVGGEFDRDTITALQDFGVDAINFVTGGKAGLKKAPKFTNELAQTSREIQSILLPSLFGSGAASAVTKAGKASKIKILADPAVNLLGNVGLQAGTGALVDVISSTSEDHNLAGTLKQQYPRTYGWISDDFATLDTDSPDIKKKKNALEGVGIGLFADILSSAGPAIRTRARVRQSAQWIPDAEKAGVKFPVQKDYYSEEDLIQNVELGVTRRSEALDELGEFSLGSKAGEVDSPMLGVHDMYGYTEQGIRSVDDLGIIAARVDNARIFNNIDSVNGRVANFISEPAIKYALEGGAEYSDIMRGLGDQIAGAGRYGYRTSTNKIVSSDVIERSMDELHKSLGILTKGELQKIVDKMPKRQLKGEIRKAFEELIDYDQFQANALLRTSIAGQMADTAEGIRLTSGSGSINRGVDQILDRMELMMVADADTNLSQNFLQRMKGSLLNEQGAIDITKRKAEALSKAKREAKQAVDSMRQVKDSAYGEELLESLMFAYEATGGNVKTVDALNNYFLNSTGTFSKALIDTDPNTPSVIMRGVWATIYNNVLSAIGTPIRAAASNIALLVEKPIASLAGAVMTGDGHTIRRGAYQFAGMFDSLSNGFKYMGETFSRSGIDPDYAGVAGRESAFMRTAADEAQMQSLRSYAAAKSAIGEDGPAAIMATVDEIDAVARHPWLRFGNRSMQAFDGFTQAFLGNMEARGRAFDAVAGGKIDTDVMETVQRKYYDEMFKPDEMGRLVLTDDAVRNSAGEISLNLDNPAAQGLTDLIKRVPMVKPFLLFTKTPLNALTFAASHTPFGRFVGDMDKFGRAFEEVPQAKMVEILQSRGIPYDENAQYAYNAIRSELKGRKAIGTLATLGAVGLFLNDRITGDGIGDRQKMATRRQLGWQKRSIKVGDKYVSYDGIPGISDLISLTANIMDNYDVLGPGGVEQNLQAVSFVVGASITEKTGLNSIEPLFDILSGNPNATMRWAGAFLPGAFVPGSSLMNETSKLFAPNLKVVDDNLASMIANRTPLRAGLPEAYDWIDGGQVKEPENAFARLFNVYSPFKVNGKMTPEKQFLLDVEFDGRPNMATDGKGVELSPQEQSAVANQMGKDAYFKRELRRIMSTKDGKAFREAYKNAQSRGAAINLKDFQSLHIELDRALNLSKEMAISTIDIELGGAISQRRFEQDTARYHSKRGDVDAILAIPK